MEQVDIDNRFTFHPANTTEKQDAHEFIRARCKDLAMDIDEVTPGNSREKSLAITKLEEVMMWTNAGIARND